MPDLVRVKSSLFSNLAGFVFHLFDLAAYEFLYKISPARSNKFFNGGYLPLAPDMVDTSDLAGEEHCAMMYHLVAHSQVKQLKLQPENILDIGCGQGGGLMYVSKLYPNASFTGIDRNRTVVKLARKNLALNNRVQFEYTSGNTLQLPRDSFDFIISVGAPTYFGLSKYVNETANLLKPGGVISFSAGYRQGCHEAIIAELKAAAADNNLAFLSYNDITSNTFASLKADIPRRIELVNKVPWPFRLYGRKWADLPGSTEYQEYEDGRRTDFAVAMQKRPS